MLSLSRPNSFRSHSSGDSYIKSNNGEWQFGFSCQTRENAEIGGIHRVADKGKVTGDIILVDFILTTIDVLHIRGFIFTVNLALQRL